jgi:ferritin-like metal-binding protein YciE
VSILIVIGVAVGRYRGVEPRSNVSMIIYHAATATAGLLAAAQAVEHYEMSRYGTLRTWAAELGMPEAVTLLEETLKEEEATDAALTKIAESVVNQEAEEAAVK